MKKKMNQKIQMMGRHHSESQREFKQQQSVHVFRFGPVYADEDDERTEYKAEDTAKTNKYQKYTQSTQYYQSSKFKRFIKKKILKLRKYLANKLHVNKRNKNRRKYKKANDIYKKKLKQVNKKITKNELKHFKWHKNVPLKLREEIFAIVKDLYKRKGIYVASEMKRILLKYQDRIGKEKFDIGRISGIEYKIRMKPGVEPIHHKVKNLPQVQEEEVKRTIDLLLKYKLIEPYEGPWAFRVFCVRNPDGTTRMVCNYKEANDKSYTDTYPTPSVPDMISKFNGKTIYSSFDIIKAFFNIKVEEESKKYTAFVTKYGTFVWNVMPFGGKNCPAVWARASDTVFKDCIDMIKYVDDFIIASKAENGKSEDENHLKAIEMFFDRLAKNNLKIKLSKCEFFVKQIKFLGNIITPNGRCVDDKYIKHLLRFRHPKTRKELKSFLGAIEWISNHIYGMKKLMLPLKKLLKESVPYNWKEPQQKAYSSIMNMIQQQEILHHPNFNEPFYIFCDASDKYYSGILLQKRNGKYVTIDMYSRMFNASQEKLHITSKELIALTQSVTKWNHYLYGRKFTIHTDALNIVHLFKRTKAKSTNNQMHYGWVVMLNEYDFDVVHIKGIDNKIADYLSRYVDKHQLENWKEGDLSLKDIKNKKQVKYYRSNEKKERIYYQKVFYANIPQKFMNTYKTDEYITEQAKQLPDEVTLNSDKLLETILYEKEKLFVRRTRNVDYTKLNKNVIPNYGIPNEVDLDQADKIAEEINSETETEDTNIEYHDRFDELDDEDNILFNEDYDIPDRVYMKELLMDNSIKTNDYFDVDKIKINQEENVILKIIKNCITDNDIANEFGDLPNNIKGDIRKKRYILINDLLCYKKKGKTLIVLPPEHIKAILDYVHKNLLTGIHSNSYAMEQEIKERFYWSGFSQDIKDYVNCCEPCSMAKDVPDNKMGELQLFPAKYVNDIVAIDHIGVLPEVNGGYKYITTYYDRFSGYTVSVPAKSIDAFTTTINFVIHWICKYGPPNKILTDMGSDFRSEILQHLCDVLKTKHKFTTAYHASTNGAVERFNRTLKTALRCISYEKQLDFAHGDRWDHYISYINSVHNNRKSRRTKLSPNEIMLGRKFKLPIDFQLKDITMKFRKKEGRMYEGYIKNMIKINHKIAKDNLAVYDEKRKEYYDKNRKEPQYKKGDLVKYWTGSYPPKGRDKLDIHWRAPYKIIKIFGNNYVIQHLVDKHCIHNANVKRIKRWTPKRKFQYKTPDELEVDTDNETIKQLSNEEIEWDSTEEKSLSIISSDITMDRELSDNELSDEINNSIKESIKTTTNSSSPNIEEDDELKEEQTPNLEHLKAPPNLEPILPYIIDENDKDSILPPLPLDAPLNKNNKKRKFEEIDEESILEQPPPIKKRKLKIIKKIYKLLKKMIKQNN